MTDWLTISVIEEVSTFRVFFIDIRNYLNILLILFDKFFCIIIIILYIYIVQ